MLNESRENTEAMIDFLCERTVRKGHKTAYNRKKARKAYLAAAKRRNPRHKVMRKTIGQQLEYIEKNLLTIAAIISVTGIDVLPQRKRVRFQTIHEVYTQQKQMYDNHTHKCDKRIINLRQPFVRTMVMGKAGKRYEFGQKLEFSVVDGFTFIERQKWEPYNALN